MLANRVLLGRTEGNDGLPDGGAVSSYMRPSSRLWMAVMKALNQVARRASGTGNGQQKKVKRI